MAHIFVHFHAPRLIFAHLQLGSTLYVMIYSFDNALISLDVVGVCVWAFGFLFEIIGDWQLANHIADKTPGKKKFINSGLWRFTRHPNYFGEALLWWGVFLLACAIKVGWTSVFAPLFITYLLRFLSGVPLLEKKYKGNPEWEEYCAQVNVFVPWCPKRSNKVSQNVSLVPVTTTAADEP